MNTTMRKLRRILTDEQIAFSPVPSPAERLMMLMEDDDD